jgi:hypothetical protein
MPDGSSSIEFRKLDVAVRETDYIAGNTNVTAIVIRNTYPFSIRLLSVTARHSTLNSTDRTAVFKGSIQRRARPSSTRIRIRIHNVFPFSLLKRRTDELNPPFLDFLHKTSTVAEEPITIKAEKGATIAIDDRLDLNREVFLTAEEGSTIAFTHREDSRGSENEHGSDISPLSEIVSEYVWRTNHWVLFIPVRIGIDIAIRYEIQGEVRSQVVSSLFDIKPPIHSLIIGGMAGGVIGNLARAFTEADSFDINTRFLVKLIGSCLLSIMAVISLSRKSGSQSFITVEDFFGSFVLGSLIGYEGTTFFDKNVPNVLTSQQPK